MALLENNQYSLWRHNLTDFLVPSLTILNFQSSILFYCLIYMKYAPNSFVLETLILVTV